MTQSLITTISGIEIWGNADLISVTGDKRTDKNFYLTFSLKGYYISKPVTFTVKRNNRNDFIFEPETHERFTSGYKTITNSGNDYIIGVNELNLGVDVETNRIEIIINETKLVSLDTLPLEQMNVFLLDYINKLVKSGNLNIYFNDVKYEVLLDDEYNDESGDYENISNINLSQYEPVIIRVVNNQIGNIFDIGNMNFQGVEEDETTGDYISYDFAVTTKEPDLIVYTVSNDVTEWERNITSDFRVDLSLVTSCLKDLNISFIARPTEPTEDYPFIKIYNIGKENIETLNTELTLINDELLNNGLEPINKYVSSLIRIPYPIESDSKPVGIQIANKGFDTTANLVSNYVQNVKLGTIKVEHDVLKGISYKNIEFKLFIPNFKPIDLETEQVINRTIDIDLAIDLTTGKGTANIKIDGTVQYIETENIGKDIPFKADNININIGSSVLETDFIKPYLLITVLEPDNNINSDLIKQRKIDSLLPINYSFIKTDKPLIHSRATRLEQLEIQRLLRNGVFINVY